MPLELWFVTRLVMRNVNLYLDTLYSAFEMIASGVTTVQHLHGWLPGKLDQVDRGCDEAIRAYQDVGMRVSYSFAVRDQNRLVYPARRGFRRQPAVRTARPDAALVRAFSVVARRLHRAVRGALRPAPGQAPGQDPACASQSALVLR